MMEGTGRGLLPGTMGNLPNRYAAEEGDARMMTNAMFWFGQQYVPVMANTKSARQYACVC